MRGTSFERLKKRLVVLLDWILHAQRDVLVKRMVEVDILTEEGTAAGGEVERYDDVGPERGGCWGEIVQKKLEVFQRTGKPMGAEGGCEGQAKGI